MLARNQVGKCVAFCGDVAFTHLFLPALLHLFSVHIPSWSPSYLPPKEVAYNNPLSAVCPLFSLFIPKERGPRMLVWPICEGFQWEIDFDLCINETLLISFDPKLLVSTSYTEDGVSFPTFHLPASFLWAPWGADNVPYPYAIFTQTSASVSFTDKFYKYCFCQKTQHNYFKWVILKDAFRLFL